jgi:hypothetical protein
MNGMARKQFLVLGCAALALTFTAAPVRAETMTEESIKAFLDETTRLTHADSGMSDKDVEEFLDDHIAGNGTFSATIMYDVPGEPTQMRQASLNKTDYIKNVVEGRKLMQNYTSTVSLEKADIMGNRANIKTNTRESGVAPQADGKMAPFEGQSSCNQILRQNKDDIVIASAACETIITVIKQ